MALTNKTIASTYGDILQCENNGSGRTASGTTIKDGLGQDTALRLGQSKAKISPATDNTTTFGVSTAAGGDLLVVDTDGSTVKLGSTQTYANTQVQRFGVFDTGAVAGTHYPMFLGSFDGGGGTTHSTAMGTGGDPSDSYAVSSASDNLVACIWYIPVAITIDEVRVIAGGEAADAINFHLKSFTMSGGTSGGSGDLSAGALLAHNGSSLTVAADRITTTTLTIDSANVAADKVILGFFENDSTTDLTAQLIVKYHYQ